MLENDVIFSPFLQRYNIFLPKKRQRNVYIEVLSFRLKAYRKV